jgi:hypothetical protein
MSTPSLNNGIFLRDTKYQTGSNVDSYHLVSLLKDPQPMDLGPVELWAMTQKVEMPLYQFSSFNGKNVILVDNARGEYKWQTPISIELPFVVEDIQPNNITKGIDGQPFQVKLSRREFGHGDIFTYDKYNGLEMYVTDEDIIEIGDQVIYTVQLVNNDNSKYLDNKYLANGTRMFRVGSARGEYGERFASIITQAGYREFYNFVGQSDAHVEYSISSRADLMARGGINADGTVPVTEIWRNFDKSLDPSIGSITQMASVMGAEYIKKAQANGMLQRTFLTNLEAAHLSKIAKDIETYLMWGKGGRVKQDGPDDVRMSVGLWKQLDSAFKRIYNKSNFTLDMFRTELYNFFVGKVELSGPNPERTLIVQTGIGGMKLINEAIKNEANSSGFVIQGATSNGIGAITGNGMDLGFGYAYTSIIVPFLAKLVFQINPAFDNVYTNQIENPLVDGFPLSSYSYLIYDVTEGKNDNIFLLKKKWDNELRWFYQNGTMDYMGRTNGFASTGKFNGYTVSMAQAYPAVWVKDPTKILKIVMKNPITGYAL